MTDRFERALVFASRAHSGQKRKGTDIPYVAHLMGVAGIALEYGADEDEAIAALLHDAVEDQGGLPMLEEIRRCFGDRVAEIVEGCTDSHAIPKPPWLERKKAYLAHLRSASPSIVLVSAADKLHNARAILRDYRVIGEKVWARFHASREEVLWYYRSLVDAFGALGAGPLVEELRRVVGEIEQLHREGQAP